MARNSEKLRTVEEKLNQIAKKVCRAHGASLNGIVMIRIVASLTTIDPHAQPRLFIVT
jgi:hypothetical protein